MTDEQQQGAGLGLNKLRNRYFVMRHGESEANVLGVAVGDPGRGVAGFGLTARGRQQAVEAAKALRKTQTTPSSDVEILASDFRRTRETAELVASSLGSSIPVRLNQGLRERSFGDLEGRVLKTMEPLLRAQGIQEVIRRFRCERAESVQQRVVRVVHEAEDACRRRTLLLVTHADPIQALMAAFAGLGADETERIVPLGYAEVAEISLGMPLKFKTGESA